MLKVKKVKVTDFHTKMFCLGVHKVLDSDEELPYMLYTFHYSHLRGKVRASNSMQWNWEWNSVKNGSLSWVAKPKPFKQ